MTCEWMKSLGYTGMDLWPHPCANATTHEHVWSGTIMGSHDGVEGVGHYLTNTETSAKTSATLSPMSMQSTPWAGSVEEPTGDGGLLLLP